MGIAILISTGVSFDRQNLKKRNFHTNGRTVHRIISPSLLPGTSLIPRYLYYSVSSSSLTVSYFFTSNSLLLGTQNANDEG